MISLSGRPEDRPEADVVWLQGGCRSDLFRIMRGEADDGVWPQYASRISQGQIFLPQVDPICLHGQRQIAPIIDDQRGPDLRRHLAKRQCLPIGVFHRALFVAVLKQAHSRCRGYPQDVRERAIRPDRRIEDEIQSFERNMSSGLRRGVLPGSVPGYAD